MASTPTNTAPSADAMPATGSLLLINLAPLPPGELEATLSNLALAFPAQQVLVAVPDVTPDVATQSSFNTLRLLPYEPPGEPSATAAALTAADYLNTFRLAQENNAAACLLLGAEANSLDPTSIRSLASAASAADLATARYHIGPNHGLVNSAILYPITRALFGAHPRFPLGPDLGLSLRMAERLAAQAHRYASAGQNDALLWPVAEAAVAGYTCTEVEAPSRTFPQPPAPDLNAILTQIAGSLFADIDAKAAFWQRNQSALAPRAAALPVAAIDNLPDVAPMLDSFHLAYKNLQELWSLVLPPQSLLGLKHLSLMPPAEFRMPDSLWARIVYDFALAWRLRTLNRSHLLGALTPLYLAWVASHLTLIRNGTPPETHIEDLAGVFERDKPYLVSRWRWPDRFNP
ncbi:hypothetical protein [Edaphobacter bradus]|uniref:hypothetical protein n=1 Tax=Edaphobacter bradus TaxID=2259016 RepID=UPI0021DF5F7D|nr:hypothetical protein [Edaphobacter bradus]